MSATQRSRRAIQRLIQYPLAGKILDCEVVHGDQVLLDADPLHNRMEIRLKERTEVNLG